MRAMPLRRGLVYLVAAGLLAGVTACSEPTGGEARAGDSASSVDGNTTEPASGSAGNQPVTSSGPNIEIVSDPCNLIPQERITNYIDAPLDTEPSSEPMIFGWASTCRWSTEFGRSSEHDGSITLRMSGYSDVEDSGRSGSVVASDTFDDDTRDGGPTSWRQEKSQTADQLAISSPGGGATPTIELAARVRNVVLDIRYSRSGSTPEDLEKLGLQLADELAEALQGS